MYASFPQQYHQAGGPPPPYQPPMQPAAGPQSNIVCANCTTLLLYPQGAQIVRCARCGEITPVPVAGVNNSAQLSCSNPQCRVVLMYPRGASQVQCSLCGTINNSMQANQIGHLVCSCCNITLMYAYGAASVKCAVCQTVTPVNPNTMTQPPYQGPSSSAGSGAERAQKSQQTVVIVNPPTLDADGNEVEDYVVGVTSSDAPQPTNSRASSKNTSQAASSHG